jgi:amidase
VTVHLPVYTEGALLAIGDGHAAQGAGEVAGTALETSMDVEFDVDVLAGAAPPAPRMEDNDYVMASGISQTVDHALRDATKNLVGWLVASRDLMPSEVSAILGTSLIYDIAEVVNPLVHVVARVPKSRLGW